MQHATFNLSELYAPIRADLAVVERVFDEEIASRLPFVNDLCDTVRSYRGKMLRPALLLLTAKAAGGVRPAHRTLAGVVEMVHMATLVHDDVLDEAKERRRRPTIAAVAGNQAAVLLGDYLISHAFHLCSSLDDPFASRRIGAVTNVVCEGELLQNAQRRNPDLTEQDYYAVIQRKTGALTAVCCELGAKFADADGETVEAMEAFGLAAGTAFQIVDDLLDITGDAREVGKSLGRDLEMGTMTLPVIHCVNSASPQVASAIRTAVTTGVAPDRKQLAAWLEETGSIDHALAAARRQVMIALDKLNLFPPSEARQSLTAMTEFILERRT